MSNEYWQQHGQFALQSFPEAIILVDNNGIIRFMNSAAIRLFKITDVAAVLATSFSTLPGGSGLMTYSQRVAYHDRINEFATHKIPDPQPDDEQRWSTGIDDRVFEFRAVPMRDEQGQDRGFIMSIEDWTGDHRAGELLAALTSELLTPLHIIRGFSELLLKENRSDSLDQKQREWVTEINETAKRLLKLRENIVTERQRQDETNG